MSYIIRNAYKKIRDYNIQKTYEHAVDEMVKRGYEPTSVKEIDGKITFEVDDVEKTGFVVDEIEAKNVEEEEGKTEVSDSEESILEEVNND